jgi:hypothetical protein
LTRITWIGPEDGRLGSREIKGELQRFGGVLLRRLAKQDVARDPRGRFVRANPAIPADGLLQMRDYV